MANDIYYIKDTIRKTLGIYKLKFDYLDELIDKPYDNIYINLDSILKTLYKLSKVLNDSDNYVITITSSIINIVAHYKLYFAKKKCYPKIYLFKTRDIDGILYENLSDVNNMLKLIFKYVPNTYYICCDEIDVAMYHFTNSNTNNLILSKSIMDLQLLSFHTDLLYMKRDESILYNIYNLYTNYLDIDSSRLSYQLFPIMLSITGVKDYVNGVKKIGKKRAHKLLETYLDNGALNTHYSNIEDFISDAEINDKSMATTLINNYELIDTIYRYSLLSSSDKKKLDNCIVDKFSYNDIKELNVKYFTGEDSIMLNELMIIDGKSKKIRIAW